MLTTVNFSQKFLIKSSQYQLAFKQYTCIPKFSIMNSADFNNIITYGVLFFIGVSERPILASLTQSWFFIFLKHPVHCIRIRLKYKLEFIKIYLKSLNQLTKTTEIYLQGVRHNLVEVYGLVLISLGAENNIELN